MAIFTGDPAALAAASTTPARSTVQPQNADAATLAARIHTLQREPDVRSLLLHANEQKRTLREKNRILAQRWYQDLDAATRQFWYDVRFTSPGHAPLGSWEEILIDTWPGFRDYRYPQQQARPDQTWHPPTTADTQAFYISSYTYYPAPYAVEMIIRPAHGIPQPPPAGCALYQIPYHAIDDDNPFRYALNCGFWHEFTADPPDKTCFAYLRHPLRYGEPIYISLRSRSGYRWIGGVHSISFYPPED